MKKEVTIEGMMCEHCKKKVENALLDKAEKVEVILKENKAILINPNVNDEEIKSIIENLEFEVVGIKNE